MADPEVSLRVDSVETLTAVNSVVTPIESTSKSSDHRVHYPGENLKPSQITCGQRNNILHVAVKYRESTDTKKILEFDPSLALETNAIGDTPLHLAARLGRLDVVQTLVESLKEYANKKLADAKAKYKRAQDEYKRCLRSWRNTTSHVSKLVESVTKHEMKEAEYRNAQDDHEKRLRTVINEGNTKVNEAELVKSLEKYEETKAKYKKAQHKYKERLTKVNNKGNTTLDDADLVKSVVEYEKKETEFEKAQDEYERRLRKVKKEGNTALHEALLNGHCEIAERLIKEDPILTSFDNNDKESPLFLAVDGGYQKTAVLILDSFPMFSVLGRNDFSIMHQIVIRTQPRIIDKLIIPTIIAKVITRIFGQHDDDLMGKVLEKIGPDVLTITDESGWMPHHYAANMGIYELVEKLLKVDTSLAYEKDNEGMSALHISAKRGHTRVLKTLIQECPDVCELLDNKGRTALHIAVEHKQVYALRTLLNTIAFNDLLNGQDNEGNTALHLSCIYGHSEIIKLLLVDPRTNKRIINKKGMTAFDYIIGSSILGPFDKFLIKSQWNIKNPGSLQALRDTKENATFLETHHQSNQEGAAASVVNEKEKTNKDNESVENTAGINVLVATIIASITFAAAMNMPGSYDSSTGLANLREKTSFRYFLVFDSLAFGCSSAVMVTHFAVRAHLKWRGKAYGYPIHLTTLLTFLSITSTLLAFILGTYSVLYHHNDVPNSKSGFGLPGNFAFASFFFSRLYLFQPLVRKASYNFKRFLSCDMDASTRHRLL